MGGRLNNLGGATPHFPRHLSRRARMARLAGELEPLLQLGQSAGHQVLEFSLSCAGAAGAARVPKRREGGACVSLLASGAEKTGTHMPSGPGKKRASFFDLKGEPFPAQKKRRKTRHHWATGARHTQRSDLEKCLKLRRPTKNLQLPGKNSLVWSPVTWRCFVPNVPSTRTRDPFKSKPEPIQSTKGNLIAGRQKQPPRGNHSMLKLLPGLPTLKH